MSQGSEPKTTPPEAPSPGSDIVLPEARMHLHTPKDPCTGVVTRSVVCTSRKAAGFCRHIEIDVGGTALAGACLPGQSIGVIPPGVDALGKPHKVRLYSICSPTRGEDGKGAVIATTVKRTIDEHWETHRLFLGVASNYLCDLAEGARVTLTGPAGKRFLLPVERGAHEYVFFATGTGIAPFRGMVLDLLERGCGSGVTLVMGAPYATDLLYHEDFLRLRESHRAFRYVTAISRERQADGNGPMYVQDRLSTPEGAAALEAMRSGRALVYICGIAGMEMGIFQQMARLLPPEALREYLNVDPEAMANIGAWTSKMIHRQVRPTRKVFLEVYA